MVNNKTPASDDHLYHHVYFRLTRNNVVSNLYTHLSRPISLI